MKIQLTRRSIRPVTRLNHAVLYVRDVDASVAFYASTLGFKTVMAFPGAAFLQANGSNNDHDLGLFQIADTPEAAFELLRAQLPLEADSRSPAFANSNTSESCIAPRATDLP